MRAVAVALLSRSPRLGELSARSLGGHRVAFRHRLWPGQRQLPGGRMSFPVSAGPFQNRRAAFSSIHMMFEPGLPDPRTEEDVCGEQNNQRVRTLVSSTPKSGSMLVDGRFLKIFCGLPCKPATPAMTGRPQRRLGRLFAEALASRGWRELLWRQSESGP